MPRALAYTQDFADEFCARVADGKSVRTICRAEDMPCTATVFKWLRVVPGFADQYARAKEEAADAMVEDMLDIADDSSEDRTESGGVNSEHINRSRLRVETRKWIAAKLKPKKYGERQQVDMNVTDERSDRDLVRDLEVMAARLGMDASTLPRLPDGSGGD
jgi:hypothetical protein